MEFVKLRYLIAVAEQRSFSKAAEKCFVSQPTLTRCVQNMEKSLGVSLFDRSCSPIQLTRPVRSTSPAFGRYWR